MNFDNNIQILIAISPVTESRLLNISNPRTYYIYTIHTHTLHIRFV